MKKILLIAVLISIFSMTAFAQANPNKNNVLYGGGKYSFDAANVKSLVIAGGYGYRVIGNLWSFNTVEVGAAQYGSGNVDIAYFAPLHTFPKGTRLFGALMMGPSADWVAHNPGDNYLAYLAGAAGVMGYVEFTNGFGIFALGKYKFAWTNDTFYKNGATFGIGLAKRF